MPFVKERLAIRTLLIANEEIWAQQNSIVKLDIEKVYDHVNWGFILDVLGKMDFGDRWIKWIERCISMVAYLVLFNGSPSVVF